MQKRQAIISFLISVICEILIVAILLAIRRRRKIRNNDRDPVDHRSGFRVLGGDDDDSDEETHKRTG